MNCLRNFLLLITLVIPSFSTAEVKFFESIDTFSGKDNSRVIVLGENDEISLVIKCLNEDLRMLFFHEDLVGSADDQVSIAYKINDREPSEFNNSNLLNPKSFSLLGLASSSRALNDQFKNDKALLGKLQGAKKLAVRIVDPYDNNQLTTEFSVQGLRAQILKLSCTPSYF